MRWLAGRMNRTVRRIATLLVAILLVTSTAGTSAALTSEVSYVEINGPREFSFQTLDQLEVLTISREAVIHLPKTAKTLLIEEYQPKTDYLESEIRAYTIQQACYWIIAVAILMYVRSKT